MSAGRPWHEDPATVAKVMKVFNSFTHHWTRAPRKREAEARCTGFLRRGKVKLNDPDPTCPGCRKKLGLAPRVAEVPHGG